MMRAALLALALAACAAQTAQPAPAFDLTGTHWQRADDADAAPHFPTLAFTARGASGYSGCNRWFAAVTRDAQTLRFGNVGMTRMACAEPAMAAEHNFADAIERTRAYRANAEELVLLDEAGAVTARFARAD